MANNSTFFCPSGGKWYACSYGTRFAGCCSVDPCLDTCPDEFLYPIAFDANEFGNFPDGSCGLASDFYSCGFGNTFTGCCRSNPCLLDDPQCPKGDLTPIFLERPDQIRYWGSVNGNTSALPPVQTAPVVRISSAPAISTYTSSAEKLDRREGLTSVSVSVAIMIVTSILLGLWLCYRRMSRSYYKQWRLLEREPLPAQTLVSRKDESQSECRGVNTISALGDLNRFGTRTLYTLSATIFMELCICGFLAFLWYGNTNNRIWNRIMIDGWVTRSIAVTALVLRTAVDLQAAIGSAILASLLLESSSGVPLHQIAGLSPMRAGGTSPWSFTWCAIEDVWRSGSHYRRFRGLYIIAGCLLLTSSLLQFSSTMLLTDLRYGPLVARSSTSQVRSDLSYLTTMSGNTQGIPRGSAWTTNPPSYPAFGEYHEPITAPEDGVADTGLLLRALLPYETTDARQRLSSYSGNALVLDARVSCQAPSIKQLQVVASESNSTKLRTRPITHTQITGLVAPTKKLTILQDITETPFDCTVAGSAITVCQVAQSRDAFTGSLKSQFQNSTAFGAAFLVVRGDQYFTGAGAWANFTVTQERRSLKASASLCFAPWDSAVLNVTMSSNVNRTEPLLQYVVNDINKYGSGAYNTQDVLNNFVPFANNGTRRILAMHQPRSYLGDLPPPYRRPVVQSDISGSSVGQTNVALPGNYTAIMSGTPLVTMLRNFEKFPTQAVVADPALAAIFNDANAATSIEWALSTLITILSMTNYYGQQPAFDRLDSVTTSFFEDVLYPRDHLGLTLLMWALTAHFIVVSALVFLFVQKTHFTLLGNAWSAFVQMAESQEVMEHMAGTSVRNDSEVLKVMKEKHIEGLRARVVRRDEGAEVVVQ